MKPFYERDGIVIYHGDCREIAPQLDLVDAIVTDPPYSIVNQFGEQSRLDGTRSLEFDWDKASSVDDICDGVRALLQRGKPEAGAHCFCGFDQVTPLQGVFRELGFTPKPFAWVKKCPPPAMPGTWWPSGFEIAIYGYRKGAWFGDENPSRVNVIHADTYRHGQPGKVDHPTQKQLRVISHIVAAIVPPGGICLDGYAGSGTTLRAAKDLGRRAIGIELNESYCEAAARRLEQQVLQFTD